MFAYFIIGAALLLALVIGGQSLAGADPKKLVKALRITAVVLLGAAAAFFALTGRFAFAPPLALAALFFLRDKPFFGGGRPSQGQKSDVKTSWLRATLNHDTGDMDGEILLGQFTGEQLSALSLQQLLDFRREAAADEQTVAILNTFLERNFSEDPAFEEGVGTGSKERETRARATDGPMSRQEAFNILELESGATKDEIKSAHRRLMKKFHPDHNGSDYMAAKLNEAKDFLLKT